MTAVEAWRLAIVCADHTPRTAARSWRQHRDNWYRRIRRSDACALLAQAYGLIYQGASS